MIKRRNAYTGRTRWIFGETGALELRCAVNHGYIYECTICGIFIGNLYDAKDHDKAHNKARDDRVDRVGGVKDKDVAVKS